LVGVVSVPLPAVGLDPLLGRLGLEPVLGRLGLGRRLGRLRGLRLGLGRLRRLRLGLGLAELGLVELGLLLGIPLYGRLGRPWRVLGPLGRLQVGVFRA
jgi:hypothetical protein